MDYKPVYPPLPALYPHPTCTPIAAQIPTYPAASQVEPPSDLWFSVSKYYLLIVNGIVCGLTILLAVISAMKGLDGLFTGYFDAFFVALVFTTVFGFISLYIYHVPIQGVIQGLPIRLIVHGVLCGIGIMSALGSLEFGDTSVFTGDPEFDSLVATYTSTSSVYIRLIINIMEVVACFSMADFFQKRAEYGALTSNA